MKRAIAASVAVVAVVAVVGVARAGDLEVVIRAHAPEISRCYQNVLKSDPGAKAKIGVRFTVTTIGRAADVTVRGGFSDSFDGCVVQLALAWRFQPRQHDASAAFEIVLVPP